MYLIKNIHFTDSGFAVVDNGIEISKFKEELIATDEYWGKTNIIQLCDYADCSKFGRSHDGKNDLLSYVSVFEPDNKHHVKDIGDGFKEFYFYVSTYQPENLEGYIVFIKQSKAEIKTNGKKIFGRYPNEIVAVLKEGNYLETGDRRIEVINNKLVLII